MRIFADLHLHSKYSRATSKDSNITNLEKWSKIKGLDLVGTSDFTHPKWIQELKTSLSDDNDTGIYKTKTGMNFILQTEISLVYTQDGKGRRVHHVILAPNFDVVDQITEYLKKHGRVDYDGRPIFKINSQDFVYELKKISSDIEVIPAHIWTPWFGALGSKSGFNSIQECFKDQTKHIHAIETGLSSDPPMNWRVKELDKYQLISNSDAHSFWPWRIGREANIFDLKKLTYNTLLSAIKTGKGLEGTIEVNPNYGIYHYTGHRSCNICLSPEESNKLNNICPVCGKPLTIGVLNRIEELADRNPGEKKENVKPFYEMLPLSELISKFYNKGINTKFVWAKFNEFLSEFKTENKILIDAKLEELSKVDNRLAKIIIQNRQGKITVKPGYDGIYGEAIINNEDTNKKILTTQISKLQKFKVQKNLNEF